ncbi:mandelate racemase/muconate lactonizing enzyme family protein [Chelatococcus sp. SYSU_G07232]|uniref:Mandelate racemase/muconate lactonizing enzyme family protein n=1 Tax=Chelatococcus albus TaxID=3047466 RepID=A0ABT7AIG7_9HYPH|nr:mandelate racemase/muconate lactonizing enzyme family protein [Chelatococcus sp. SYSU_G07232]MDJ1159168.1 mandelate racemase/muconate lactonizing enzyme family protein [Chelatococcus sp. SYSU_G07232]
MKITAVETVRLGEFANICWVRLHTDEGLAGLGETFMGAAAVEAYVHETAAAKLIGRDPLQIEGVNRDLANYLGWRSAGVETRGNSAIDIALWDIFGKAHGKPVCDMLGGRSRDRIRVYNTCAGYKYIRDARAQKVANWGVGASEGPYEDLEGFLHRADELAHSLLEQGIRAMKIWPFDVAAERSNGYDISPEELRRALEPFARIRKAVGDRMDIMVEFHSLWSLPMAKKLARVLADYDTYWHEDPFRLDNVGDLRDYAEHCKAWVCASETLSYTHAFREYLETGAAGVAMLDLSWCGGLSEARKIAALAEAWHVPVAPHDCTGPVVYAASCHFSLHARNALIQESVRAFYTGWYTELVTELPAVTRGEVTVNMKPGLGLELLPGLTGRPDAVVRVTRAGDL